jgi:hypothetical protein
MDVVRLGRKFPEVFRPIPELDGSRSDGSGWTGGYTVDCNSKVFVDNYLDAATTPHVHGLDMLDYSPSIENGAACAAIQPIVSDGVEPGSVGQTGRSSSGRIESTINGYGVMDTSPPRAIDLHVSSIYYSDVSEKARRNLRASPSARDPG